MAVGIYMDVHIPRAVTNGLRLRGVDVLTAQEDGTITMTDSELLDRASELNRILYSQDEICWQKRIAGFKKRADLRA